MGIELILAVSVAVALAIAVWLVTYLLLKEKNKAQIARMEGEYATNEARLKEKLESAANELQQEQQRSRDNLAKLQENYDKALSEIKENHKETLQRETTAIKAEMTAQTEKLLKQREEELSRKAEETFKNISNSLGKDFEAMKAAFDENKKSYHATSGSLKEKFDNAVNQLEKQTKSLGLKADNLAQALRGQKKMQGCWGETILSNLLRDEGLVEGRDYDREETLRNELGIAIKHDESAHKMRPDFILHFADRQDVVVDSKVSLNAYMDYMEAEDEDTRKSASERNAEAIKKHVKTLSAKKYVEYLRPENRMVDYVIMFVPNYPALQLAYEEDPDIWRDSYRQKVLITTAETLIPFLRMITMAWRNVEQVKNQQKIIEAAQDMINRVGDFYGYLTKVGEKLAEAQTAYENADKKVRESGQSIIVSANKLVKLGVRPKKALPEPELFNGTENESEQI
ncbi:MAG: DNA recombination protein RmuC [Bacteroidales bacterium]|nr:DNA recombination protein RmuC [Bacteroidales bacterium]